jgi:hypothetical protein
MINSFPEIPPIFPKAEILNLASFVNLKANRKLVRTILKLDGFTYEHYKK